MMTLTKSKVSDPEKNGPAEETPLGQPEALLLKKWVHQLEPLIMTGKIIPEVIHDINNQLTGILGYAELLSMKKIEDESIKNGLKNIYLSAEKCKELLANLLSLARQETSGILLADVNEMIEKTIELRSCAFRHGQIEISMVLGSGLPLVPMAAYKLQKVFLHLIFVAEEALEHRPQGKKIIFKTDLNPQRQAIVITITDNGSRISVDPFGVGRSVETLNPRIDFEFSEAQGLIGELGGTIERESLAEEESAFVIHLPVKG